MIHLSSILYLRKPKRGGRLCFEDGAKIIPEEGTLVIFTSGQENIHWIEEVTEGDRVALTMFWTCDIDFKMD